MSSTRGKTAQNPLTPTVLNQMLKKHLSEQFGSFWLTGEVFELYRSPAGHSYFTLKDPNAAIKCVMFRQKIAIPLEKGMQVTLLGQMTLYTPKGDIQVNALKVMEAGQGDLAQQFLILKQKLMQAGLFDASNKKKIPDMIQSLGIITSAKGAALQDILNVLQRQNPLIDISIYPTLVQGNEAPPQINDALRQADEMGHDVLLLTRGGGSKEDLWAFNDEFLAHQLAQLQTPVIAAIGHETDESIADLVADLSCITPTAAAQYLAGDFANQKQQLTHHQRLLQLLMQDRIRVMQQRIDTARHHIESHHPTKVMSRRQEKLVDYQERIHQAFKTNWRHQKNTTLQLIEQFKHLKPDTRWARQQLMNQQQQAEHALNNQLSRAKLQLAIGANNLNNQNPLNVLSRGYSVTTREDTGEVVTDSQQVNVNDNIITRLKNGRIHAKIFERLDD